AVDCSIQVGRQFDRAADIWLGGANVYFGATAEPSRNVARHWHIESDLTDYSALFNLPQLGQVILGNLVNSTFTSILFGSADLQFYPLAKRARADGDDDASRSAPADIVLPLSAGANGGTLDLTRPQQLSRSFSFPL